MAKAIIDIETNGLKPTRIWVMCVKNLETGEKYRYYSSPTRAELSWITEIIGHNIIEFDLPAIKKLWFLDFSDVPKWDTLIVSRMMHQAIEGGHSMGAWGRRLGYPKGEFSDWSQLTPEMVEYCERDVDLNEKIYNFLLKKMGKFEQAIRLEHDMAELCMTMQTNGFHFNATRAKRIRDVLSKHVQDISTDLLRLFPPKIIPVGEITPTETKSGSCNRAKLKWYDGPMEHFQVGCPFTRIQFKTFNPDSPKQLCEVLHQAGWKPTEKTDGHKDNKDPKKAEHYKIYGYKINEANLATLPETAPKALQVLILRVILVTRIRKLDEWLGCYNEQTGRIHGNFNSIGTWTHRMSHSNPNMGNVSAKKSIKYNSPELNKLATYLGGIFRTLWCAPKGKILVGVDAEGIQLRVLAHYMDDKDFTFAVTSGRKEDGTDPHTLNKKALGHVCSTRDKAKTFIYAFLLGAGIGKIAEIFDCSRKEAEEANNSFIKNYPGLVQLKSRTIPEVADRGFFYGLDGRPVVVPSERLVLAGFLQEGESTLVKKAAILATRRLHEANISYEFINIVHDEMIFMVDDDGKTCYTVKDIVEKSIKDAGEQLQLKCPMKGDGHTGYNWLTIH